ncbi:MAG TPA: PHP domain-containing protein [Candidatus Omnitrophica bacterium]|nr:PHP domain-containing protein [Candidatus Omnitrophota bacterium]
MFDLHTHSILSDGELLPSELACRYEEKGFRAVAITDHVDLSNIKQVVISIVDFCAQWPKGRIKVIPGVELTHLPLEQFTTAAGYARKNGIKIIVAHGQTIVEPVVEGTARAALSADIDILSHPGLISEADVKLAARRGIFLELSARKGHCLGNGHVARLAVKYGAKLCVNSDSHSPSDIPSIEFLRSAALGAGLSQKAIVKIHKDIESAFFL